MKLSIITINLNNSIGLNKTIRSVLLQTWKDFEYIIIDGLSSDSSIEIIKKYDSSISFWSTEKDNGVYDAMNKGIIVAKGEYILFLNSGDSLFSETTLAEIFSSSIESDFIFGSVAYQYPKKTIIYNVPKHLTFSYLYRSGINHQSTFTKRSIFSKYGKYDITLKIASDWKVLILALCKYNSTYVVRNTIVSLYDTQGLSAFNNGIILDEKWKILNENFPFFVKDYARYFRLDRFTFAGVSRTLHFYFQRFH